MWWCSDKAERLGYERFGFDPGSRSSFFWVKTLSITRQKFSICLKNGSDRLQQGNLQQRRRHCSNNNQLLRAKYYFLMRQKFEKTAMLFTFIVVFVAWVLLRCGPTNANIYKIQSRTKLVSTLCPDEVISRISPTPSTSKVKLNHFLPTPSNQCCPAG